MKAKQEKMTLEKLAIMINNGFENARIENMKQHEEIKKELKEDFRKELNQFKAENTKEHEEMKRENSREREDLKLRQDNIAYRFELVALEGRVRNLEKVMAKK